MRRWTRWGLYLCLGAASVALGCRRSTPPRVEEEPQVAAKPVRAEVPPLDVGLAFPAVERVGAKNRIRIEKTEPVEAHSPPDAWRIDFEERGGFAGVCWKNEAGNEGQAPGEDLSKPGYRRLTFWAKGAAGGEVVEFRAGGLGNIKTLYRDSFDVTAGKLRLGPAWKEYTIYVMDADLSSVMTPFCALFHREDHPGAATVFLDDIEYRG